MGQKSIRNIERWQLEDLMTISTQARVLYCAMLHPRHFMGGS